MVSARSTALCTAGSRVGFRVSAAHNTILKRYGSDTVAGCFSVRAGWGQRWRDVLRFYPLVTSIFGPLSICGGLGSFEPVLNSLP